VQTGPGRTTFHFVDESKVIARLGQASRIARVRRNHALEHATITVVSSRHPNVQLRGHSNWKGFYIVGDIDTVELRSAIDEAAQRLRAGQAELAIHPRCGTNLAVSAILSGLSAALASRLKPRQNRYSYAILASLAALWVSPDIGTETQKRVTTLADLGDLRVEGVDRDRFLGSNRHWVRTRST
jgi:Domain of unknown function (DUF6391)